MDLLDANFKLTRPDCHPVESDVIAMKVLEIFQVTPAEDLVMKFCNSLKFIEYVHFVGWLKWRYCFPAHINTKPLH